MRDDPQGAVPSEVKDEDLPSIDELLKASNWEERLAIARVRRAKVLAARRKEKAADAASQGVGEKAQTEAPRAASAKTSPQASPGTNGAAATRSGKILTPEALRARTMKARARHADALAGEAPPAATATGTDLIVVNPAPVTVVAEPVSSEHRRRSGRRLLVAGVLLAIGLGLASPGWLKETGAMAAVLGRAAVDQLRQFAAVPDTGAGAAEETAAAQPIAAEPAPVPLPVETGPAPLDNVQLLSAPAAGAIVRPKARPADPQTGPARDLELAALVPAGAAVPARWPLPEVTDIVAARYRIPDIPQPVRDLRFPADLAVPAKAMRPAALTEISRGDSQLLFYQGAPPVRGLAAAGPLTLQIAFELGGGARLAAASPDAASAGSIPRGWAEGSHPARQNAAANGLAPTLSWPDRIDLPMPAFGPVEAVRVASIAPEIALGTGPGSFGAAEALLPADRANAAPFAFTPSAILLPEPGSPMAQDATEPPQKTALAPARSPAVISGVSVFVFAPSNLAQARVEATASALEDVGFPVREPRRVEYKISKNHVRYYYAADAQAALGLADALGGTARDFTNFSPLPPRGTLEVWLQGDAPARRVGSNRRSRPAGQTLRLDPNIIALRDRLVRSLRRGEYK